MTSQFSNVTSVKLIGTVGLARPMGNNETAHICICMGTLPRFQLVPSKRNKPCKLLEHNDVHNSEDNFINIIKHRIEDTTMYNFMIYCKLCLYYSIITIFLLNS